ncbi:MAG: outer membrane beta-barrel protein [Acidobacteriaceae bacterium]
MQKDEDVQSMSVDQLRTMMQRMQVQMDQLRVRLDELEHQSGQPNAGVSTSAAPSATALAEAKAALTQGAPAVSPASAAPITDTERSALDFLRDTTFNFDLDGYYDYNFNQPIGGVNLLRAYDVTSNSFNINQVGFMVEHAPDVANGRRWGGRVDFQYGQATETLQGSAANELRPQVWRNLFQAYGTYVAPVGSGLQIDFGKWASALGVEGNYTKDQINYSRSYYFNFLPFYHMGFRASYNLSPKVAVAYWLVNGAQQTEDFNGFKSQAILFTLKPCSRVTWNVNYYTGQEQRAVVGNLNPGLPSGPTQPGLPTQNISPLPNGREHIFDIYATWNPASKWTFVGEADYVINRTWQESAPAHVIGGAAYVRYQLTPRIALATRGEYLSDRGGLFSGTTQALKEGTATFEYKLSDGFLSRLEYRRDWSNVPFFLTDKAGVLQDNQDTATMGLVWWWGGKQGSW